MKKKVFVGLSGGVDSAVAALKLKDEGYEVTGVHMQHLEINKDINAAKEVAEHLNIPLQIIDLRKEFKKSVIDRFINDYRKGITPNPCVICNKSIKFGLLWEKLINQYTDDLRSDWKIATGHYARVKHQTIYRGIDKSKDQSYFLCELDHRTIGKLLLPLGEMLKEQVREEAEKAGIPSARRKDSQDVCFISCSSDSTAQFLKETLGIQQGSILEKHTGNIIGEHEGSWFFTKGQRKGIGVSGISPYYVVGKDKNKLFVSADKESKYLISRSVKVKNLNLIKSSLSELNNLNEITGKVRYGMKDIAVKSFEKLSKDEIIINFEEDIWAATPGQYAVLYKGEELLGGGEIIVDN